MLREIRGSPECRIMGLLLRSTHVNTLELSVVGNGDLVVSRCLDLKHHGFHNTHIFHPPTDCVLVRLPRLSSADQTVGTTVLGPALSMDQMPEPARIG